MREQTAPAHSLHTALAALIACQIGLHACTQGMRLAAPLLVLRLQQGAWSVGMVLTMFALVPAMFAIPAGRLVDRHGYHLPVRIAALSSLAGTLIAAIGANLPALCVAAALCGTGSGFGMIAIQRTAGRLAHNETDRLRLFSWIALAPALAGMFGPMLAGALIDHAGFSAAFASLALLPAATLLFAQAVPRETGRVAKAAQARRRSAWNLLTLPEFRRLLFINWLVSACWDVHGFALPILGVERGLSASALGAVLGSYAVSSMLVRLLIPIVAATLPRRLLLVCGLLLTCSVFALYPFLRSAWAMAACAAMLGIALGAIQPAILATLHDVTPHERHGEALAFRSMTVHLSMSVMPLAFGLIGTTVGATLLFWMMAAALGLGSMQAGNLRAAATD